MTSVFGMSAQSYDDVVYLKNGSIIRGTIVEQVMNESVKVQTKDGNYFVFSAEDIQKISKEVSKSEKKQKDSSGFNKPKGFLNLLNVQSYTPGTVPSTYGVEYIFGYRVCPQFAVGFGQGIKTYRFDDIQIPMFVHLRSDFMKTAVSPYVAVNVGYNFGSPVQYDGYEYDTEGTFFKLELGVSYNVGNIRMTTGFGFKSQDCERYLPGKYEDKDANSLSELFSLNIGFSF